VTPKRRATRDCVRGERRSGDTRRIRVGGVFDYAGFERRKKSEEKKRSFVLLPRRGKRFTIFLKASDRRRYAPHSIAWGKAANTWTSGGGKKR